MQHRISPPPPIERAVPYRTSACEADSVVGRHTATPPTTPAAWPVPHVHCIEPSPPTFKLLNQIRDKFTQAGASAVRFVASRVWS
jgi:hypothetical protein